MKATIYISFGVAILALINICIELYKLSKHAALTDEDKKKLGTLLKFRQMVAQNDSELKRGEINEFLHEKQNKEITKLIDKYEETAKR